MQVREDVGQIGNIVSDGLAIAVEVDDGVAIRICDSPVAGQFGSVDLHVERFVNESRLREEVTSANCRMVENISKWFHCGYPCNQPSIVTRICTIG